MALLFVASSWQAHHENSEKLPWSEKRPLKWDDFQGPPKQSDTRHARTFYDIHYSGYVQGDEIKVEVKCAFKKNRSWVKDCHQHAGLLRHEQTHFDLAEVGARRMRMRFSQTTLKGASAKHEIKRIYGE